MLEIRIMVKSVRLHHLSQKLWNYSRCRTLKKLQQRHSENMDDLGHPISLSCPIALKTHVLSKIVYMSLLAQPWTVYYTQVIQRWFFLFCVWTIKICITYMIVFWVYFCCQNFQENSPNQIWSTSTLNRIQSLLFSVETKW